jgi:phosphohistidine phosphatase
MRHLTLLRHAKSSWEVDLDDHDRPLGERGLRQGPMVAAHLVREVFGRDDLGQPGLVLSSTAARALATAGMLVEALREAGHEVELREEGRLYLASPREIMRVVAEQGGEVGHVVVVGHNPGLEMLASELSRLPIWPEMKTATAAVFGLGRGSWAELELGQGRLLAQVGPMQLEGRGGAG